MVSGRQGERDRRPRVEGIRPRRRGTAARNGWARRPRFLPKSARTGPLPSTPAGTGWSRVGAPRAKRRRRLARSDARWMAGMVQSAPPSLWRPRAWNSAAPPRRCDHHSRWTVSSRTPPAKPHTWAAIGSSPHCRGRAQMPSLPARFFRPTRHPGATVATSTWRSPDDDRFAGILEIHQGRVPAGDRRDVPAQRDAARIARHAEAAQHRRRRRIHHVDDEHLAPAVHDDRQAVADLDVLDLPRGKGQGGDSGRDGGIRQVQDCQAGLAVGPRQRLVDRAPAEGCFPADQSGQATGLRRILSVHDAEAAVGADDDVGVRHDFDVPGPIREGQATEICGMGGIRHVDHPQTLVPGRHPGQTARDRQRKGVRGQGDRPPDGQRVGVAGGHDRQPVVVVHDVGEIAARAGGGRTARLNQSSSGTVVLAAMSSTSMPYQSMPAA